MVKYFLVNSWYFKSKFCTFNQYFVFQKSGIDKIIPNMAIDDFLFQPCGYSMNGIGKNVSNYKIVKLLHILLNLFLVQKKARNVLVNVCVQDIPACLYGFSKDRTYNLFD